MSTAEVIIYGRLNSDGTLELDERPAIPVGPVEITIRSLIRSPAAPEDWWQYLQHARSTLESARHRFRTKEEIDAEIEDSRAEDPRIEQTYQRRSSDCIPRHPRGVVALTHIAQ